SDQFSLGVVLYEMLAGRRPFVAATLPETLTAIIREEPEPLEKLAPAVPAPVSWIVERCLAKAPGERYDSTRDLARDLDSCRILLSAASSEVHHEPGPVLPAPRRRRLPVAVAAGLVLLVVLACSAAFLLRRRAGAPAAAPGPSIAVLPFS